MNSIFLDGPLENTIKRLSTNNVYFYVPILDNTKILDKKDLCVKQVIYKRIGKIHSVPKTKSYVLYGTKNINVIEYIIKQLNSLYEIHKVVKKYEKYYKSIH
jgi:hypothetical protein